MLCFLLRWGIIIASVKKLHQCYLLLLKTRNLGGGSHSEWPSVVGSPHLCW